MVDIHLYGKLRRFASDPRGDRDSVILLEPQPGDTIASLLAAVGISLEEVHHVFYNSNLLATHSGMATVAGFPQSRTTPFDWDLNIAVKPGDRIGVFGKDIALLGQ